MPKIGNLENTESQMRKGTLEFMVMLIVAKGPTYAADILVELKQAELIVVEGTLYPLLTRLKTSGLLSYTWEESAVGPPRKYYALTKEGQDAVKRLAATWDRLNKSIKALRK